MRTFMRTLASLSRYDTDKIYVNGKYPFIWKWTEMGL